MWLKWNTHRPIVSNNMRNSESFPMIQLANMVGDRQRLSFRCGFLALTTSLLRFYLFIDILVEDRSQFFLFSYYFCQFSFEEKRQNSGLLKSSRARRLKLFKY